MNKSELFQRYARTGALARLNELRAEMAEIEAAFPDLRSDRAPVRRGPGRPGARRNGEQDEAGGADARVVARRTRKPMSAAQKKAVGERMRKYWAARRKSAAKGKS